MLHNIEIVFCSMFCNNAFFLTLVIDNDASIILAFILFQYMLFNIEILCLLDLLFSFAGVHLIIDVHVLNFFTNFVIVLENCFSFDDVCLVHVDYCGKVIGITVEFVL